MKQITASIVIGSLSRGEADILPRNDGGKDDFIIIDRTDSTNKLGFYLKEFGIFKSIGDARRNNWDKEIPEGYECFTIGKLKHEIHTCKHTKTDPIAKEYRKNSTLFIGTQSITNEHQLEIEKQLGRCHFTNNVLIKDSGDHDVYITNNFSDELYIESIKTPFTFYLIYGSRPENIKSHENLLFTQEKESFPTLQYWLRD